MKYWLVTSTDSESYMFKKTYSDIFSADNPLGIGKQFSKKYSDRTINTVTEIFMSNRSLAQAYTHKITLKEDILDEKKGTEFVLFDDGKVFDAELMAMRQPKTRVALMIQNYDLVPTLMSAVPNPKYHKHIYVDKTIKTCECGDVES